MNDPNRDIIELSLYARRGRLAARSHWKDRTGKPLPHWLVDGLLAVGSLIGSGQMAYNKVAQCAGLACVANLRELVDLGLIAVIDLSVPGAKYKRRDVKVSALGLELIEVYCKEVVRVWGVGRSPELLAKYSAAGKSQRKVVK